MPGKHFSFSAPVCRFPGFAAWYLVPIPGKIMSQIRQKISYLKRGWGSFPVTATLGNTVCGTSIFSHNGSYFIALKTIE